MSYSQPYIILIILFLALAAMQIFIKFDKKSVQILNGVAGLTFILFFGFRGLIGWDWNSYYPFYKAIPNIFHLSAQDCRFETGFCIFASLIKTINPGYHFFIFVNTIIDFILLHIFFKRYLPPYLYSFAFAIFIVMGGIVFELDLLRNIKGLLLFLISIRYIENRKIIPFLMLNLIGLSFHWSSIVFFPLYFFIHKKIDLRVLITIAVVGNVIYLFQIEYIKPFVQYIAGFLGEKVQFKTEVYMNASMFNQAYGITLGYLERLFTTILVLFYYNKLTAKSDTITIFINSFFIFFIFFFFFSELSIIVSRLARLFYFSYWIIWAALIDCSNNTVRYLLYIPIAIFLNLKIARATNIIFYQYDNVIYGHHQEFKERKKTYDKNVLFLQQSN